METATDPGKVILEEVALLDVERARIEAKIAAKMLDFQDLRRHQAEANPNPTAARLEASFAADELGVALHQPTRTVQCRLAETRRVRGRMMLTWQAFAAGKIDSYRVSLIASALDKLRDDNHATIELDHRVTSYAPVHTAAQLKGWLKRFVAKNAPDHAAVKAEKAKRSVWVDHQDDGMSFLHAYIPTAAAVLIDALLTERAKKLPVDDRTLDHKRADEFVAQLLGTTQTGSTSSRALCRRHHRMKTYNVTGPTDHIMRDHTPSRAEHDMAEFLINIEYAA